MKKSIKKLETKAIKNVNAVKGGDNGGRGKLLGINTDEVRNQP